MITEKTLKYIQFMSGFNTITMEQLEGMVEVEIEELNGYNSELAYEVADINDNATLKAYIIECLKLSLQTRWGNNLEYHQDRKLRYLNKLTNMQV